MFESGQRTLKDYSRCVPLLYSYNNFRTAACIVNEDEPETVKNFLYATLAFGFEVALWSIGAPYKVAFSGTRYIANRTFLRFAKYGCRGCVAVAMSELHWAIRASVYHVDEVITENRTAFVIQELSELQEFADEEGYDVDIEMDKEEIEHHLEDAKSRAEDEVGGGVVAVREPDGFIDRLLPDNLLPDFPEWW